jgi:CheY-like chemotaxis protein
VVGPRDGAGAALLDLARSLGFASVERYQGLSRVEQKADAMPLVFFLCAAVPDLKTLKPAAEAIRQSPAPKLRFSPLIYLSRQPALPEIRTCIQMGFDDIIALPFGTGDLGARILRQVGRPQVYYETPTYFGPDPRNRTGENRSTESDRGGGQYRRIEIMRSLERGIEVLSDDLHVVV